MTGLGAAWVTVNYRHIKSHEAIPDQMKMLKVSKSGEAIPLGCEIN